MPAPPRRIVVTGANKGVGQATVGAILTAHDDTHVFLGSRSLERGEAAKAELVTGHGAWADRITVLQVDVADDASVRAARDRVASLFADETTPLYAVVNNAGIGLSDEPMRQVLEVNTYGPRRVCEAFIPLLDPDRGRVANVSSASGPNFVAQCSPERQRQLTDPDVTWEDIAAILDECLAIADGDGDFASAGFGDGRAYGLSKACLNAYTMALARAHPSLTINACTPGFIYTDLTRHYADSRGADPAEVGMKRPEEGTRATLHLLFGDIAGSGWYFGSDAQRSPIDRYRSPGDPPYTGD